MLSSSLEILRLSLLKLKPSGSDGFEGLLSLSLTKNTGITFRLASSGLQFGIDGASSDNDDLVYFEAKRYDDKIPRETVVTKIADLGRIKDTADVLWILGATTEVSSQLTSDIELDGHKHGIATVVFDWTSNALPKLAVIIASLGDEAAEWIVKNSKDKPKISELRTAITAIKSTDGFESNLSKILSELSANSIATSNAVTNNKKWMQEIFSSEANVRSSFGQPMLLLDPSEIVLERKNLTKLLKEALENNETSFLLGEEGSGKSWLAAGLACNHDGLALFLSAERFEAIETNNIESLIIETLITQTGDRYNEELRKRWEKRVDAWQKTPTSRPIVVIVDGINQRPDIKWDRIIFALQSWLSKRGGKLVITARPKYFQTKIKSEIGAAKEIKVEDWSEDERNEILKKKGIQKEWLDQAALNSLLNPRLLGIAVIILPKEDVAAWRGLTINRLLFEHIRLSQRNKHEEETAEVISSRLSEHAKQILETTNSTETKKKIFSEKDTSAVAETRFFKQLPGPNNKYEIVDEGINLALGFAIVDRAWEAIDNNHNLSAYLHNLIEPILALDKTADILLAALTVCALDDNRFNDGIFIALLGAFSGLQNLPENFYDEFFQIVKSQPDPTLISIEKSLLEFQKPLNHDWLLKILYDFSGKKSIWPIISSKISDWLGFVCTSADDQLRSYLGNDKDKREQEIEKRQNEIDKKITDFLDFEKVVFTKMKPVRGDTDSLLCVALRLLAHKPLKSHTDDFLKLVIGFSINNSAYQARKEFINLVQFNTKDWLETSIELQKICTDLKNAEISKTGKWALVKLLLASDTEECAQDAKDIIDVLRSGEKEYPGFRLVERYCSVDPCNPSTQEPKDFFKTIQQYKNIEPHSVFAHFSRTQEEYFREKALPSMARFAPQVAIDKHVEVLNELKTRTELPLRQLALCGTDLIPLVQRGLAKKIMARLQDVNLTKGIDENDKKAVLMYLLYFAYQHLTAEEQLEHAACSQRTDYLLDITASMKPQEPELIVSELKKARKNGDSEATFFILSLVANSSTEVNALLADELVEHINSNNSLVRASVFQIIEKSACEKALKVHANSDWNYISVEGSNSYEAVYGSHALILAASRQMLTVKELISRITPSSWYYASSVLGSPIRELIVTSLDKEIIKIAENISAVSVPMIEIELGQHEARSQWWTSIENVKSENDLEVGIFPKQESNDEFNARQKNMINALSDLQNELIEKNMKILLDHIDLKSFGEILEKYPETLEKWASIFLSTSIHNLRWLKNIALVTARFLTDRNTKLAIELFEMLKYIDPVVTISKSDGLTLEHEAVWSCPQSAKINILWNSRIKSAKNDAELSLEILAAERYGASSFIREYVTKENKSGIPLNIRYAITIAGFSNQYDFMSSLFGNYEKSISHVEDTATKALESHMKATWSEHWYQKMCDAKSQEDFWIAMKLMLRIVDTRTTIDAMNQDPKHYFACYRSIVLKEKEKRSKRWQEKRKKTLLGAEAPNPIFLESSIKQCRS